jgi:phage terminase small subunit
MATRLTEKQRAFIASKAAGDTNRDAAMAAGYTMASADVRAAELMRRPEIKAAIKAVTKATQARDDDSPKMLSKYKSSLVLLQHCYNNPRMTDSQRIAAATTALPYEHARMGETGKKQSAKDNARVISRGRGKFATKSPPHLSVVRNND